MFYCVLMLKMRNEKIINLLQQEGPWRMNMQNIRLVEHRLSSEIENIGFALRDVFIPPDSRDYYSLLSITTRENNYMSYKWFSFNPYVTQFEWRFMSWLVFHWAPWTLPIVIVAQRLIVQYIVLFRNRIVLQYFEMFYRWLSIFLFWTLYTCFGWLK